MQYTILNNDNHLMYMSEAYVSLALVSSLYYVVGSLTKHIHLIPIYSPLYLSMKNLNMRKMINGI